MFFQQYSIKNDLIMLPIWVASVKLLRTIMYGLESCMTYFDCHVLGILEIFSFQRARMIVFNTCGKLWFCGSMNARIEFNHKMIFHCFITM